jgi:hypothetical protein
MYQRDRHRAGTPGRTPLPRRAGNPVLALQRFIGNRGTAQLIAREAKNKANFERGVVVDGLGPIEIKGGNVDDWLKGNPPEELVLTTVKGKHSDKLKGMTKVDVLKVNVVIGENTILVITIKHGRIRDYAADEGKTESWKLVGFDDVHRDKTSIGKAR